MVLACRSWTCKGKMSGGGWWRDCFTSNQSAYIYIYQYISISLKGCFPMLSRSDPHMPQDSNKDRPGTVPKLSTQKVLSAKMCEAAPSPATLRSEKPAMPLLPGAWLQ